jgi:hypothetical protein
MEKQGLEISLSAILKTKNGRELKETDYLH